MALLKKKAMFGENDDSDLKQGLAMEEALLTQVG